MRKLTQLYTNIDRFVEEINEQKIDFNQECLVKIFTSIFDANFAFGIAQEIKNVLPNCKIVGTYSDIDVIYKGENINNDTLIIVEAYKDLTIISKSFSFKDKHAKDLAKEIYDEFKPTGDDNEEIVNVLFSDLYYDVSNFVDEINKLTPILKLSGGIACCKLESYENGFLFDENGFIEHGAIAFLARGHKATHFGHVSTSQEKIGSVYELTKVNDNIIEEIDNQPALKWLYDYLEIKSDYNIDFEDWKFKASSEYLIHFPLMRENSGGACRYTKYDEENDQLETYFSKYNTGDKFNLGYVNPQKTIQETYELCSDISVVPVESMFVYVCLFRKIFLQNCIALDLSPFLNYDISGCYMMGEIAFSNGQNNFHNGCCSLYTLSENDKLIIPNLTEMQTAIKNVKNDGFLTTDRFTQRNSSNKSHFMQKIEDNHKKQEDVNFIDPHFKVANGLQYKNDKEQYAYNKICMIEIQTADATISLIGEDDYYDLCQNFIKFTNDTLSKSNKVDAIRLYSLNYKTFVLSSNSTVNDDIFVKFSKTLSSFFENKMLENNDDFSEVARFVVLLKQVDPLAAGLNVLFANKDSQENFLVYDSEIEIDNTSADELKMIDIIKKAIANNKIIPYYQGLHNNKKNILDKYESLMRLEDETGRVYTPYFFMDIAKKYKFYAKISRMLIKQVLDDFYYRTEDVSINISLYDIESTVFRELLLEELNIFPDPTRVVFEIVETEDCKELDILYQFIDNIRATGAKIAIDDFGSGYSTFATVVDIEPNFLKIDGSIIGKITENEKSLIILDTIKYLANKMNIETIGEFVENEEIQNILMEYGITYSQGYYFAKPVPFNELNDCI